MRNTIINNKDLIDKIYDIFASQIILYEKQLKDLTYQTLKISLSKQEYQQILNVNLETRLLEAFFDLNKSVLKNETNENLIRMILKQRKSLYADKLLSYYITKVPIESKVMLPKEQEPVTENILKEENDSKETIDEVVETKEDLDDSISLINEQRFEHVNSSFMYMKFIEYTIFLNSDHNKNFIDTKNYLELIDYEKLLNNNRLNDYYEIFKSVNYYQLFYLSDYLTIYNRLLKNKDRFIEEVKSYNKLINLFKVIRDIDESNDDYLLSRIFKSNLIKLLNSKNINTFKDLKTLSQLEIYEVFKDQTKIKKLIEELIPLKEPIITIYNNELNTMLNNQLKDDWLYVLNKRSTGMTLEAVGTSLGVTRERIRQIESRSKGILIPYLLNLDKYLKIIAEDEMIFKPSEIDILTEHKTLLRYIHPNYLKAFDAISLVNDYHQFDIVRDICENAQQYFHESEIQNFIEKIKFENNLDLSIKTIKLIFDSIYENDGEYYYRESLSFVKRYEIILKDHFDDYEGLSNETVVAFKNRYYEVFKDESIYSRTDRSVIARAVDNPNVLLLDKGLYIYKDPDQDNISDDLYVRIYKLIENEETLYVESIYQRFYEELKDTTSSRFELHGKIKRKFPSLYFSKDFVSLYPNPQINTSEILDKYLLITKGVFDIDDFILKNPKLMGLNVEQFIYENDSLIPMFNKKYIHKDYIDITETEIKILKDAINELFIKQKIISGHQILSIMNEYTKDFVIRNDIRANVYAYHITRHFLDDNYHYKYPNIFIDESDIKDSTFYHTNKYVIDKVFEKNWIRINEIREIAEDVNISIFNIKEYLEYFYDNGYLRFDELSLAKKDKVLNAGANNYLTQIENDLLPLIDAGYEVRLSELNFDNLPKGIKWNIHLLAHLILNLSNKIEVVTIGQQYNLLDYILRRKTYD